MKRLLCVAVAMATLLAGGCGIPDRSDVTVVDDGPSSGVSGGGLDGGSPVQSTREDTEDPETLVEYYLQAAAGDPETALTRVKAFLSPTQANRFQATTDVKVVREVENALYNRSTSEVTYYVQAIGTLKSNGVLEPADPSSKPIAYRFRVGPVNGEDGLFILEAPPIMVLTDEALGSFYQRRTIYWWDNENTGLVPDLRYMPRAVPTVQQPTTILGWLTGGPAPWLTGAVQALPQGSQASDNVPAISNDTLQISLNAQTIPQGSDPKALDRLRRQLQWSLRPPDPPSKIEIKIGHDDPVRTTDGEYLSSNAAYRLADTPERFALYGNTIRRLKDAPHANDPVPVIKPAANKNIASAAIAASATRSYAAVVTGTGGGQKLRVAQAPLGQQSDLREVRGVSGSLGAPVWAQVPVADDPGAVGLITMDGVIYSFGTDGANAQRVEWQGVPGAVTAISVAPDGHRVALVSGGRLYRTVLNASGDGITLSSPEQVLPPVLKTATAVSWSSETYLTVAGVRPNDRVAILDVTIDGALAGPIRLDDIGAEPVTYLTAYPSSPVNSTGSEQSDTKSFMAGNSAYDVLSEPVPITPQQLVGPVLNPPATAPTAPFFLD